MLSTLQRPISTFLLLFLATAGVIWLQGPPGPIPASAPTDRFSAERATVHVREIAREPHPPGTPAHDRVRDYLVGEFQKLGFATAIQKRVVQRFEGERFPVQGTVENVIADKAGSAPTGTLLLVAHYDSHGTGPGAGDDAAGVAALLEAARAMGSGRNRLRILITDGEEVGLLGAQGYVDSLEGKGSTLALNFEARGGGGPVFMFETSEHNLPLIREFAGAAPTPHASSLTYALYKTLPNDTDLTVLKQAGMAGFNFAFVGRWQHYHSMLDTPEGLDPRSLQQQGATALALGRHFLASDLVALTQPGQGEAIYFDLGGWILVVYPAGLAWPLTALVLGLFAWVLWHNRSEREVTKSFLVGLGLAAASLAGGALAGSALGLLVNPFRHLVPNREPYGVRWFEASLLFAALALVTLVWGWALRRFQGKGLALGALVWWLLALVATTAMLPGASYLFLWPLLFVLLGLWWEWPWAGALPLLLLFPPVWHNLVLLLGFSLPAILGLLVAFGTIPLLPLFRCAFPARLLVPPALLLGLGVLCFGVGSTKTGPRVSTLAYLEDADSGKARWLSFHPPDAWTRDLMKGPLEPTRVNGRPGHTTPAPCVHVPPPTISQEGNLLTIMLPERALALVLEWDTPGHRVLLEGRPLPQAKRFHWFAPPQSCTLTLENPPGTRLTLEVILPGLPTGTPPRPAGLIPAPVDPYTDNRILRRVLVF